MVEGDGGLDSHIKGKVGKGRKGSESYKEYITGTQRSNTDRTWLP